MYLSTLVLKYLATLAVQNRIMCRVLYDSCHGVLCSKGLRPVCETVVGNVLCLMDIVIC